MFIAWTLKTAGENRAGALLINADGNIAPKGFHFLSPGRAGGWFRRPRLLNRFADPGPRESRCYLAVTLLLERSSETLVYPKLNFADSDLSWILTKTLRVFFSFSNCFHNRPSKDLLRTWVTSLACRTFSGIHETTNMYARIYIGPIYWRRPQKNTRYSRQVTHKNESFTFNNARK